MPVTVRLLPRHLRHGPPPHTGAHNGARVTHSSQTHRFHATRSYAHARSGVACAFHGDAHGHPHTFSARSHARLLP
ncbi:hypothetical protein GWK47_027802 [Chionoecetes opilio]|uniref:Uncharacterized protein n=1 Tax=Chionoecetes opilio TaxID=41210 RepID=A0A8J8WDW1_CHIOP|nr:hypothetical protein GWK47_027802 [Chionoecetes opilio]